MKHTSKTATKTLEKLRTAAGPAGYASLTAPGFMPLHVEMIDQREPLTGATLELWAISHTYEQNGDLMRDPEVVFLRVEGLNLDDPTWYPVEYRQDPIVWSVSAKLGPDLTPVKFYPRRQRDLCSFVTAWCSNINSQGHTAQA